MCVSPKFDNGQINIGLTLVINMMQGNPFFEQLFGGGGGGARIFRGGSGGAVMTPGGFIVQGTRSTPRGKYILCK